MSVREGFFINQLHHGCSTGQGSFLVYGGEAHEERCEEVSMPDQEIGRYSQSHKLLEQQIFSQTCPGTLSTAVPDNRSIVSIIVINDYVNREFGELREEKDQILRRKCFFSDHSLHCLDILPNGIICIQLRVKDTSNQQKGFKHGLQKSIQDNECHDYPIKPGWKHQNGPCESSPRQQHSVNIKDKHLK